MVWNLLAGLLPTIAGGLMGQSQQDTAMARVDTVQHAFIRSSCGDVQIGTTSLRYREEPRKEQRAHAQRLEWPSTQTYAATAYTSGSEMYDPPRGGITLPDRERSMDTPVNTLLTMAR